MVEQSAAGKSFRALANAGLGLACFDSAGARVFANSAFWNVFPHADRTYLLEAGNLEAFFRLILGRGWVFDPGGESAAWLSRRLSQPVGGLDHLYIRFGQGEPWIGLCHQNLGAEGHLLWIDSSGDQNAVLASLSEGEGRYRIFFHDAPIGLWEEDYSGVKRGLDALKAQGVTDLRRYLSTHPDILQELADSIVLLNINLAAAKINGFDSRDEFFWFQSQKPTELTDLKGFYLEEFLALADGKREFSLEHQIRLLSGEKRWARVHMRLPVEFQDSWGRLFSSEEDITKERQAIADAVESESRFRGFVETAADWFWETDQEMRFTTLPQTEEISDQVGVEEFLEKQRWELADPTDLHSHPEKWNQHRADIEARLPFRDFVYRQISPQGDSRYIRTSGKPIFDDENKFQGYRGAASDITGEVLARQEADRAGHLLVSAIEDLSEIFVLWDKHDCLVMGNREFRELNALIPEACMPGTRYEDHLRAAVRAGLLPSAVTNSEEYIAERVEAHMNPQEPFEIERQDGRWILVREQRFMDGSTASIATDITLLKDSAAALSASEQQFRDLVEGSLQGVVVHEDFVPLFVNQTICDLLGFESPKDFIDQGTIEIMFDPDEVPRMKRLQAGRLRGDEVVSTYEVRCKHRDGRDIILLNTARRVEWQGRRAIQAAFVDITSRVRAEEQLNRAQRMEALGQLTGGVAHDFNNLLAIIQGNAELLEEQELSSHALVDPIIRASSRGRELTQRLLAYGRRQPLAPTTLDVNELIASMLSLMRRTIGQSIAIQHEGQNQAVFCLADPGQLENAILNLVINARDAMPEGGTIFIRARPESDDADRLESDSGEGDFITIEVEDEGIGMTPEVRERAFEPFFTTKEVGKGSGLGLSMAYGFANQSGGGLVIRPGKERGTSLVILLPKSQQISAAKRVLEEKPKAGFRGRVLLVEDDLDVRQTIEQILVNAGWEVTLAASGLEGEHHLFGEKKFDLLISDVILPGKVNGITLARQAARELPQMRILLMSGFPAQLESQSNPLPTDFALILKPFRTKELPEKIEGVFREIAS